MSERSDAEAARILAENERRARELPPDRYAYWDPTELFLRQDRVRVALKLLRKTDRLPMAETRVLEVGCGTGGWLPELVCWGVPPAHLSGIDLDEVRVERARERLPTADLRPGDAAELPWEDGSFDLLIASTVFSSILDPEVRRALAAELLRVLRPAGAVLWYDFRYSNPRNRAVRGMRRRELERLFPGCHLESRSCGLLPPLARAMMGARATGLTDLARLIPFLRSHLTALLYLRA